MHVGENRVDKRHSIRQIVLKLQLVVPKPKHETNFIPRVPRVSVEAHFHMKVRIHHLEIEAEARFSQHQSNLLSQFSTAANQVLATHGETWVSGAFVESSRCNEEAQHPQSELQCQAAQAANDATEHQRATAASQQCWNTKANDQRGGYYKELRGGHFSASEDSSRATRSETQLISELQALQQDGVSKLQRFCDVAIAQSLKNRPSLDGEIFQHQEDRTFLQRQVEKAQDAVNDGKIGNSPTPALTGKGSREPRVANSSTGSGIVSVRAVSPDSSSFPLPATDHCNARTALPQATARRSRLSN